MRISIFARLGFREGKEGYKETLCSSTYALLSRPQPSHTIRLIFRLPDQSAKIYGTVFLMETCVCVGLAQRKPRLRLSFSSGRFATEATRRIRESDTSEGVSKHADMEPMV
jgi:hypothetical protein